MTKILNLKDRADILLLQTRLDDHIKEYKEHCGDEEKRWSNLIFLQETNTLSIKDLTNSTKELTESTRDIVAVWKAADGTIKTMSLFGKFVKWVSGFAIIGVIGKWVIDQL